MSTVPGFMYIKHVRRATIPPPPDAGRVFTLPRPTDIIAATAAAV